MFHFSIRCLLLTATFLLSLDQASCAPESLEQRAATALTLLDGAENRFDSPNPQWFEETRQALSEEVLRVDKKLSLQGDAYAAAWKKHFRWPLLTENLGNPSEVNLNELALVRRWLFSNREGLESSYFAQLRKLTDAHLDAAFTFTQPYLEQSFQHQLQTARQLLEELPENPNDQHAAALGRSLGWFERTGQLTDEMAAVRALISLPNAQIVVNKSLIDRALAVLATKVEQRLPVSDRVTVPGSGLMPRSRTAHVQGIAHTQGTIGLELLTNHNFAEMQLIYQGEIESRCRAMIGPVSIAMQTLGPVRAITPVQLSLQGVQIASTKALPQVRTRVTNVQAKNAVIRRLGERRARDPESTRQMNVRASTKTANLLQEEMAERIDTALQEIQAELQRTQKSLDGFKDVFAPIVREGAAPHLESIQSTDTSVIVNVAGGRREHLGAVTNCPTDTGMADVQARFHVSFFNNMAETIMAGKTFTDTYFMNYGKILHPELPPPLMVHARAKRWSVIAAKPRPLEISIPAPNQLRIELRMQHVEIGGEHFSGPTIATIQYALVENDFDEITLERQGNVQLDSELPEPSQAFLLKKLDAFFGHVLSGGGVAMPEGGALGRLRGLQPAGVFADRDWLVLGVNLPTEILEAWLPATQQ